MRGKNGKKQPKTHETNKEWQQRNGKTKFMHVNYKVDVTLNSLWNMLVIRKCSFPLKNYHYWIFAYHHYPKYLSPK
jgi:hypothetical protein